jgi:hypothetical protein
MLDTTSQFGDTDWLAIFSVLSGFALLIVLILVLCASLKD